MLVEALICMWMKSGEFMRQDITFMAEFI